MHWWNAWRPTWSVPAAVRLQEQPESAVPSSAEEPVIDLSPVLLSIDTWGAGPIASVSRTAGPSEETGPSFSASNDIIPW